MKNIAKLIDNKRTTLAETLRLIATDHEHLSIATGYWDLPGTLEIINEIKGYESIRLLIGKEPLSVRNQRALNIKDADTMFPDRDVEADLVDIVDPYNENGNHNSVDKELVDSYRGTVKALAEMLNEGRLKVKVFRKPFMHAKAYIFGDFESDAPVGIVGSSNFTKAGLACIEEGGNAELNTPEQEALIVKYPINDRSQCGHLSWFEEMWNDPNAIEWSGEFSEILRASPVGDLTFGAYDVYIRTLMEIFPDELNRVDDLSSDISDVLYSFQNRNAGILLKKLERMGVAMLSDSVGLGKTITAGAVIKTYREEKSASRVVIIAPAALKQQWTDDLGERFGLQADYDFKVFSMQDIGIIESLIEDGQKPWIKPIDLFVIDEAHNLRTTGGTRYEKILELLRDNFDSKVLLLTATPINNSLMDFANQIQLGLKGELSSISVPYPRNDGGVEKLDFFEALKRIQGEAKKEEAMGRQLDWTKYGNLLSIGFRHYLVRSTRQGVEAEGGIISKDGKKSKFPKSNVEQIRYQYEPGVVSALACEVEASIGSVFEGIDPMRINLEAFAELTQQTEHPLDSCEKTLKNPSFLLSQFDIPLESGLKLFLADPVKSVMSNIYQTINMLGFVPYRPDLYMEKYHRKPVKDVNELLAATPGDLTGRRNIKIQMTIHNMLHITWLKRLESSAASLLKSVRYYLRRVELFEKCFQRGYIVSIADISLLQSEYAEDIDVAFGDFEKYMNDAARALANEEDASLAEKHGIEIKKADPKAYNIDALQNDIERDKRICGFLIGVLEKLTDPATNCKLQELAKYIEDAAANKKYGRKIVVFSFFADTIKYLEETLPGLITRIPDFKTRAGFVTGGSGAKVEQAARRFSPISKKYILKEDETGLDYLFATDVLSEGQNLQDSGMLINYDLHWNPVCMIQRNGRINRLGSDFEEVLIANTMPHDELDQFLRLVRRLERKITTIQNTIGIDQGVLDNEINPIEFIEEQSDAANLIYSTDTEVASSALAELENQDDILSWTDKYVYELRQFVSKHGSDEEIQRLRSIPLGKWNYLPKKTSPRVDGDTYLALERVTGRTSLHGEQINETLFIAVKASGLYTAEYIDDTEALALIRTKPDDNERMIDRIETDRGRVARRASTLARRKAETLESVFDLKPRHERTLNALREYFSVDIQGTVKNGMRNAMQKRKFERIVGMVKRELKEAGRMNASTVAQFEALLNDLLKTASESREIDQVVNIFFYGKAD